ncbi:TauD/TfdA family dioxygenase [Pseudochelatococcus sp. B33]
MSSFDGRLWNSILFSAILSRLLATGIVRMPQLRYPACRNLGDPGLFHNNGRRKMMNVRYEPISEGSAWRGEAIGGKEGLVYAFSDAQIEVLHTLLERTKPLPIESIEREAFDDPQINSFLADVAEELNTGKGAVVLRGLSRERYSDDELTRLVWGIGTHLGIAGAQNKQGDKIDHVRDMGDNNPLKRRQYGTQELVFHTDGISGQMLVLLSLRKSKSGGKSKLVSALAIHNVIAATRPDLLDQLYEGHPYDRKGKQPAGLPAVSPFKVPVFSCIDGIVSVSYIRDYMDKAAEISGIPMPEKFKEAVDLFDKLANDGGMGVEFMLEPGEVMIVNNRACLHSRTEFEDYPEPDRKRHLVRLWLRVPQGRPYNPMMDMFYDSPYNKDGDLMERKNAEPAAAQAG